MEKDAIFRLVGAVQREVSTREYKGAPARVITASRAYDTDIEDLWDAVTNPERIPRWMGPVSGDLRLGGQYQIEGNASGEITECTPPERVHLTWVYQGYTSWVEVALKSVAAEKAELRIDHIAHIPDEYWDQYGPGSGGVGWEIWLRGLEDHLADDTSAPIDEEAWLASDEGRLYLGGCSDSWAEASIAAGTDPDKARAAARRTTEFYSGG